MEIKTSKGVYYVNADYTIEEKQGEYPKLTCTIPATKNKTWIDDCKELDRLYTPGEQDEFVIINPVKITKGDSYDLEITAVGAFEFDFVKSRIDDNLPTHSYAVEYLLDLVFKDTRYSYDLQGTYEKREFTNFGSDNRYKLFLQIMNRFNLEFKIIGKIVRINSKIGNDTGFQFRYLKNIKDTKYSVDATNLVTHVKGYGAYHDANDQSKGRLEVEYLSPLSDIYGKLSGEPVVDERMSISATLLEKCKQSVESSVAVTVSTTLVALKNQEYRGVARVGDSIWFIDERIELEKKIRFSTVESYYDAFDELIKQDVQLGDKDVFSRAQSSDSASHSKLIDMQKELSDQLADVEDAIKKTYVMPSGVNRVFYSSDLPEDVPKGTIKEGDTLFRNIDGETKMYRWDGVQWELVPVVNDVEKFREELDNEIAQVEQSMQAQSEEHDRQVADILSKTQSVEDLANQAKTDAANAITTALQSKDEAIADARAQVATVSQALNTAKTELQSAIASADQKARDSQASATALRNDLNLQASKILAQAQAQTALTNRVTTVETLADGTRSTVAELSKTVSKATGDITSVTSRTKTVEDTLSQTKTQYEALTQTINTQTGQIDSINRKTADLQSGIDGVTEKFGNLRIGARNYAEDYDFSRGMWEYSQGDNSSQNINFTNGIYTIATSTNTWHQLQIHSESGSRLGGKLDSTALLDLEAGEIYTLSVEVKVNSGSPNFWLEVRDNGLLNYNAVVTHLGGSRNVITATTEWVRYSVTGTIKPNSDFGHRRIILGYDEIGSISFRKVELSRGTKPMDTGSAVEDTEGRVETLRSELGTYIRNATENSAELVRRIETADGKAVDAKNYAQQTATAINTRLESLETYKDAEGTRANQYLTASRTETAKQLSAERVTISANYVAKSTYDENVRGTTQKLNEIKTTADTAKQNLATYKETVDRKLTELTSSTQTLDGKINTASAKVDTVAGQIRTEISEVEGKIPTTIGTTNYIRDFGFANNPNFNNHTSLWKYERIADSTARSGYHIKATCTRSGSNGFHRYLIDLRGAEWQGRTMTYSVDVKASKSVRIRLGVEAFNKGYKAFDVTTEWQRFVSTDTVNFKTYYSFPFYADTITWAVGDIIYIRDPQLEDGSIATTAHAAEEDLMTEIASVKTTITQTASGVEQLSTSLAATDSKVSTAEAKIRNLVNEVSSKVSQTDYNTLTGRVDSAETAITQNAQEISKRLTSSQVDKAITDKGYQTKSDVDSNITGRGYITNSALQPYALSTTVQNLVKETADSFSRTISETRGLIPSNVGTRNLLKGTKDLSGNDAKSFNTSDKYLDFNIARSRPTTGYSDTFSAYTTIPVTANDYIISFYAKSDVDGATLYCHFYNPNTTTKAESSTGYKGGSSDGLARVQVTTEWQRYWVKWSQSKTDTVKKVIIGRNNSADGIKIIEVAGVALYEGALNKGHFDAPEDLATVTALHAVNDTVDSHTRTIGAVGETGSILDNVSKVTQTAAGLVQEVSGSNGLKTQVSTLAGSYAIKNLTKAGDVLGQINLNPDGSVRINEGLISIGDKTYIKNGVIKSAMIGNGQIGTAHIGEIDAGIAKIINLDVSNIKGLDAEFIKAKIENAFIEWMKGKTITAQNEAMTIGLNDAFIRFKDNAKIEFQSENNTLYRTKNGTSAFIHFRDDSYNGVYTAMGVNADNTGTQNDYSSGLFAGVRVIRTNPNRYSGTAVDQVQIIADEVRFRDAYGYDRDYLTIIWDQGPKINLVQWMRQFNTNFKHLVNITGRGDVIKTF
ncbi:TPA: phage tail protein [Streptococcus suis]|nr:phage tail protein [Streptococcus suis]HEM6052619.1 phage tail protein [Streptococcus suis]HEM6390558.1 phage tail protein [Streptococcus suis]